MRLAAKLILLFLCGLMLIVGVFVYATMRRERDYAIEQHERYAREIASLAASHQGGGELSAAKRGTNAVSGQIQIRRIEMTTARGGLEPQLPAQQWIYREQVTTIAISDGGGRSRFVTYVPIFDNVEGAGGNQTASYEISAPDLDAPGRVRRTLLSSLLTLLGVSGLSAMVVYFGGIRMVGRPLDQLIDKVERVSDGDLGGPVELSTHDELADLGRAINTMCESLSTQRSKIESETAARVAAVDQLRHADRLRSVGRMAAGVAHEIGTPLNVVSGRAELIASGELTDQAAMESAKAIKAESDRIASIIRSLLDFARERPVSRTSTDLCHIAKVTADLLRPIAARTGSVIKVDIPGSAVNADVDPAQIQQVLTNLISNAIQSREREASVNVRVVGVSAGDSGPVQISISDNGQGMTDEVKDHLFEPFYTTKDVGKGTGLGLAISHGIVQEHGGEIRVESVSGKGSTFTLCLPRSAVRGSESEAAVDPQRDAPEFDRSTASGEIQNE